MCSAITSRLAGAGGRFGVTLVARPVPDRRASIHRRRRNLLAGAFAAFALGIAVGATSGEDDTGAPATPAPGREAAPSAGGSTEPAAAPVDRLSLREQVGHLIVLRFAGTTPPAYVREVLRERRAAGVILFRDNVVDAEAAGAALRRLGITVSLAPVGDVPSVGGAALAGREFASEPEAAGAAMAAAVRGWRAGGVAATAKHFPGLGGATVNTDDGPATVDRTRAQIER